MLFRKILPKTILWLFKQLGLTGKASSYFSICHWDQASNIILTFHAFPFKIYHFLCDNLSSSDCNLSHYVIPKIGNSCLINLWKEVSKNGEIILDLVVGYSALQTACENGWGTKNIFKSFIFVFKRQSTYFGKKVRTSLDFLILTLRFSF